MESSSRFWASQSSRSSCWALDSEEFGSSHRIGAGLLLEQLVERPQRRQRRAQLVRNVRQELAAAVAVADDDVHRLLNLGRHGVELAR